MNSNTGGVLGSPKTIALGDALQRVAAKMFQDTARLLQSFKHQDAELRTTDLRDFISLNKAKLLQLLCLVRWLSKPNTTRLFHGMAQYSVDMSLIDAVLSRNLDEMFFIHGHLYPLRSSKHECRLSRYIVESNTYPALPLAASTGGRKPLPRDMDEKVLRRKLNICIRAKLALVDHLPIDNRIVAQARDGTLVVALPNIFTLTLTLQTLNKTAAWMIVNFICSRRFEGQEGSINYPVGSEMKLLSNILQGQVDESRSVANILAICEYISKRIIIRGIYDTLRSKKMAMFANCSDVRFVESLNEATLWICFWKSEYSKHDQFALKIHSPAIVDSTVVPSTQVQVVLTVSDQPLPHFTGLLPELEEVLAAATSVQSMIDAIIGSLCEIKLALLARRFLVTLPSDSQLTMRQESDHIALESASSAVATFSVELRSGRYIINPVGLATLPGKFFLMPMI